MDDEQERAAASERVRRYRERLKQDPTKYAQALERRRMRDREYHRTHRDERVAWQRAYNERNREQVYASNRAYAARNRAKIRAKQHETYVRSLEANRARDRERRRKSYARNPQAHLEYMKKWRTANPERARAYVRLAGHRRRAAAGGEFIRVEDWLALLRKHDGRCAYCGIQPEHIEADHRIPLSRGGRNTIANILPACRRCNRRKMTKTDGEFRAWLVTQATGSLKARETERRDGLAEAIGPYRTTRSRAPRTGTARSRLRCLSRAHRDDPSRARDRRRC